MLYLTDTAPKHCPSCARAYTWQGWPLSDFLNGCSQVCQCGARFQYLASDQVLQAAQLNPQGDLREE